MKRDWIVKCLETAGAPKEIIQITEALLVNIPVLMLNGKEKGSIETDSGLSQGCVAACMLYIIAVDPLIHRLAKRQVKAGQPEQRQREKKHEKTSGAKKTAQDKSGSVCRDYQNSPLSLESVDKRKTGAKSKTCEQIEEGEKDERVEHRRGRNTDEGGEGRRRGNSLWYQHM